MNDLVFHSGLFLVVSGAIVAVGCMYSEPDDGRALRAFPGRWFRFLMGSALVVAIMLVLEHTFAAIH